MTNCAGIHCARMLADIGIDRATAIHMLMDELQLTVDEATTAVEQTYSVDAAGA